jgi:GDP-L-fucose synthase
MNAEDKIYVSGHTGLIGSAILRRLEMEGYSNIVTRDRSELDLLSQDNVQRFFEKERPQYVFFAAGKAGGIYANNSYRAEFIYENLAMQNNVIHQSFLNEVQKLIFLSCSCVYPQMCMQPMKEEYFLTGLLEPTCEPVAIAKIAGMKMCESYNRQYGTDFISIVPASVYGVGQNYDPMSSTVIPALVRKFYEAKKNNVPEVVIWGSGRASRDFIYADDLADAAIFIMNNYMGNEFLNVGTGIDYTISELVKVFQEVVDYQGKIVFDSNHPDGAILKLQDVSKLSNLGWKCKVKLREGISGVYEDFCENVLQ